MLVLDTFALFEWLVYHNPKYQLFFEEVDRVGGYLTELVLLEFYHKVFHEMGKEKADQLFGALKAKTTTIRLTDDRIKKTGKKRSEMLKQKKKLSYADSLNLVVAEEFKTKVLTGDKEFRDLAHAEFVA